MITEHIKESHKILVTSHIQPDGDAIGSMLALGVALKHFGKKVTLYNESPIPAIFRFLPSINLISDTIDDVGSYDTVFILDCGGVERVGSLTDAIDKIPVRINIDHHITNSEFGTHNIVDSNACATAELVYSVIRDMEIPFDKTIAMALYTAILTDTGSFLFQNTNSAAFSISSEMVQYGADPYMVAQFVYATYSLGRLKLLNMVLDTIEISDNGKLSTMFLAQKMMDETGTQLEDIYGLVNYAKHIEDVKVAALIRETKSTLNGKGSYHVSLRSNGSVDVAHIASNMGGGGHHNAAGYKAENITFSDLRKQIFTIAKSL